MRLFGAIRQFFADVKSEFKRVSWPTRDDTLKSTGIVVFLSLVMAVFLGVVDTGLSSTIKFIIRGG
ncbi:MAG: preprotein translocase subunit SecE [Candidatus Lambdaproteobacteria bacterium]|nr:preprotein translocase subunit SecE [Candidatus Lambdaproteobacteria bacterium]